MAKCMDWREGYRCPALCEVKQENLYATGGGWEEKQIDGKQVVCCRPAEHISRKKPMDQYCFYCLATPMSKKIGSIASWPGSTPKWCPLGRTEGGTGNG